MGHDKALLRHWGVPLVVRAAAAVADVVGSVTILGDPDIYGHFGWLALADETPGRGPIGGLLTALENSTAEWNLLVACDMPELSPALFRELLRKTVRSRRRCIAPVIEGEFEPLCAVYRRSALPEVRSAIAAGHLKMRDLLQSLAAMPVTGFDPACFRNVNTPEDWSSYLHRR
jgi:molybdopterin-guanine dinucleotide biosynthesis protein A